MCVVFPIRSHNEVICLERAGNCLARGVKPNGGASEGKAFLCYSAVKKKQNAPSLKHLEIQSAAPNVPTRT